MVDDWRSRNQAFAEATASQLLTQTSDLIGDEGLMKAIPLTFESVKGKRLTDAWASWEAAPQLPSF